MGTTQERVGVIPRVWGSSGQYPLKQQLRDWMPVFTGMTAQTTKKDLTDFIRKAAVYV